MAYMCSKAASEAMQTVWECRNVIDNTDRDDLLGVFMGMPVDIRNLPSQISGGTFQGYVEGWSWSTRFNELFLTINVSPTAFNLTNAQNYRLSFKVANLTNGSMVIEN